MPLQTLFGIVEIPEAGIGSLTVKNLDGANLNNLTRQQYFSGASLTNAPDGADYIGVHIPGKATSSAIQVLFQRASTNVYMRRKSANTWSSWFQFTLTEVV